MNNAWFVLMSPSQSWWMVYNENLDFKSVTPMINESYVSMKYAMSKIAPKHCEFLPILRQ